MSEQGTGNANSVMANLGGVALLRTYREARLILKITPDPIYSAIIGLSH